MSTTASGQKGTSFTEAKKARADEFYTQLPDIERELRHYKSHFRDKVVYANCDDPRVSNFFHYFSFNFEKLGLKRLITTCYKSQEVDLFSQGDAEKAVWLEYNGDLNGSGVPEPEEIGIKPLNGDGDFRSLESIELLKQADVVVTNPPFSLFRQYVAQLVEYDKKFVIVGSTNAITYKDIFPLIRDNRLWLGHGFQAGNAYFRTPNPNDYAKGVYDPETGLVKFRNVTWFTNLDISKRHEELVLYKTYNPDDYPAYDNFDAIEVSSVKDIPKDYEGLMGVPVTFLESYNPDQFEIVGITTSFGGQQTKEYPKQIQVNPDGKEKTVGKLNDAPAMKVATPPVGKTYYKIGDEFFILRYHRVLVRRK